MPYTQNNNGVKNHKTKKKGGLKKFIKDQISLVKAIEQTRWMFPKEQFKKAKQLWKKHGPVINPSTKNPRGLGK